MDLLVESWRLPEILVYVQVSEKEVIDWVLDKNEIQQIFDEEVAKKKKEREEERNQAWIEKIEDLKKDEEMTPEQFEE